MVMAFAGVVGGVLAVGSDGLLKRVSQLEGGAQ